MEKKCYMGRPGKTHTHTHTRVTTVTWIHTFCLGFESFIQDGKTDKGVYYHKHEQENRKL